MGVINHSSMNQSTVVMQEEEFDKFFSKTHSGVQLITNDKHIPLIRALAHERMKRFPIYNHTPRIREFVKGYGFDRGHLTHAVITISATAETPNGDPLRFNENIIFVRGHANS